MCKYIIIILLYGQFVFSQEQLNTVIYNRGFDGIVRIINCSNGETIVISTFNSKVEIKLEVAENIYHLFEANKICNNDIITIDGKTATVTGKCLVKKNKNITNVEFYYQEIKWDSGITEIYKKTKP